MGSVCVHKKDHAGDNLRISVESRIVSRHLKHSGISEMCSAIPRLLEQSIPRKSELTQAFPRHLDIPNNSETPRESRLQSKYSLAYVDIWSTTQHAKKSRIRAVRPLTSHTVVWFSRAADSSSVLCHDFFIGLGEFPFMERRIESVLFILIELLEPKWWPGVLR